LTRILGIDPGSMTGYAVRHSPETWDSGTWDLSARRHEGGGMRFLRLRKYLVELLDSTKPDVVAYEEVRRHLGTDAAHVYGGCVAVISSECEARSIPYLGIPVATVKKLATGKGNADKEAMLAAGAKRWPGYQFATHDECDARWIAEAASKEVSA